VLTLYTTPVVYLFFDRLAAKFSRSRAAESLPPNIEAVPGAT
jgi:hypothetical protein